MLPFTDIFLRTCLSKVKYKDQRSLYSFRITNVELDQSDKDKLKIVSSIAITGVSHLYYIIEHLMLNDGSEVKGVKPRSGNFSKRKDLESYLCFFRLDGRNLLGSELADATKRDNFTTLSGETLAKEFNKRYGDFIVQIFEKFLPYEIHNKAVLNLEYKVESNEDRQLKPILFEGQGIIRVFDSHRDYLKSEIKEGKFINIPEVESISKKLDATAERVFKAIEKFKENRVELYIEIRSS